MVTKWSRGTGVQSIPTYAGIHNSKTLDPNLAKHPPEGIQLSEADERALVAFLKSLADPQYFEYSP